MGETRASAALRELGAELREARDAAGLSLRALAVAANISSHSRISEMEHGQRLLAVDEFERILDVLNIGADDRERIVGTVRSEEGPGQLNIGPPDIGQALVQLIDHERSASRITSVAPLLIPGLVQTSDYARAILGKDSEARVALRSGRRDILTRRNPVEFCALIDSEALLRPIAAPDVMLDQLQHLLRMAELPNVEIQIISSTRGGYNPMLAGPFELIGFAKARPIVHLEHHRAAAFLWEEDDVQAFVEAAEFLRREVAMSPKDSVGLIADIVNGMETT
jgi:transcriptional regulator with XRE-family HTH domain